MSETEPTTGIDLENKPHKSLLKRIDIGLLTGMLALLLSLIGLFIAQATLRLDRETQKVEVLPIIDIDLGYISRLDAEGRARQFFEVTLTNAGAGIAHIQSVVPMQNGARLASYEAFDSAIMTGRMLSWATLDAVPASGYLRAGESLTPVSYRMGRPGSEVQAYLRGEWGTPLDGLDVEVCYCSVLDDCWRVRYLDRRKAKPVRSCGVSDVNDDVFRDYIDQRTAARKAG